ncbi:MAG: 2-oxo acid dehydrogenase subunit E2 [Novosphingobium sp.]
MPIAIKMPALSPTMEEGKLARWLVKVGDTVSSGDIMAEIETDKATMEFEAVDEGTIVSIDVAEGTEGVKVGTVIAQLSGDGEVAAPAPAAALAPAPAATPESAPAASAAPAAPSGVLISPKAKKLAEEWGLDIASIKGTGPNGRIIQADVEGARGKAPAAAPAAPAAAAPATAAPAPAAAASPAAASGARVIASPLAKRIAAERGVDLAGVKGSGPNGRIVRADVENAPTGPAAASAAAPAAASVGSVPMADETRALLDARIPHTVEKLSGMRKTIARRLAQSMSEAPHIYLTVDVQLDKLLKLRGELNAVLEKDGVKLSVNDMLVKALGKALVQVPECNVTFAGNEMIRYSRADVSVAVSIPGGLITPIVQDANGRSLASIANAMKDLGQRAREGRLQPDEYQGGTASLSNMGMMGIKHFTAVINPPQSTILAVGAGEKRPWVMPDGSLGVANVMTVTGSFDHRAVDGADGARLMAAFRELVENPLGLVV